MSPFLRRLDYRISLIWGNVVLCFDVQEEREEEEILLQPIGPGMQTLESEDSGTLRQRSLTPVVLPEQQGIIKNTLGENTLLLQFSTTPVTHIIYVYM